MRYLDAYALVFRGPGAWPTILFTAVCMLIPIIGPIVVLGFLGERLEAMTRAGEEDLPAFDFNRFLDYLKRGVWIFLVNLVLTLAVVPVYVVLAGLTIFVISSYRLEGAAAVGTIGGACVLGIVVYAVFIVLMTPMLVRAALTQDFAKAFSRAFVTDFVDRVGVDTVLVHLFIMITSIPLMLVGYLLCLIGVYPAMTIVIIAQWHLFSQLYQLHLARGGMPADA